MKERVKVVYWTVPFEAHPVLYKHTRYFKKKNIWFKLCLFYYTVVYEHVYADYESSEIFNEISSRGF